MYDLTVEDKKPHRFTTRDMNTGDIGLIIEGGYVNNIVLKIYGGFVSLSDPSTTWEGDFNTPVCLYKSGQVIKLTIK